MNLEELQLDCAIKQKKGLHFILASIFIWCIVLIIHLTSLPILTKNLFTFCSTAPLMPLAYLISKLIKVDFQNKENPLTNLGVLFFCQPNVIFINCYVDISDITRENANDNCNDIWGAFITIQLVI